MGSLTRPTGRIFISVGRESGRIRPRGLRSSARRCDLGSESSPDTLGAAARGAFGALSHPSSACHLSCVVSLSSLRGEGVQTMAVGLGRARGAFLSRTDSDRPGRTESGISASLCASLPELRCLTPTGADAPDGPCDHVAAARGSVEALARSDSETRATTNRRRRQRHGLDIEM